MANQQLIVGPPHAPPTLPVELHKEILQYMPQPELLRMSSVSKHWRKLAMEEPRCYIAVRFRGVHGSGTAVFLQRLYDALHRGLPVGIILDLERTPSKAEREILAKKVFPAIGRAIPHARKLSIVTASPLAPEALEILLTGAPTLREFVFRMDMDVDEDESYSGIVRGGRSKRDFERIMHVLNLRDVLGRLFSGAAPKLTRVALGGNVLETLPEHPVSAFKRVTHVAIDPLYALPEIGLGAHFPEAKHMQLVLGREDTRLDLDLEDSDLEDSGSDPEETGSAIATPACARSAFLPVGLASLDVRASAPDLRTFVEIADLAAVPDLRIAFDGHYSGHGYDTVFDGMRDAAWAGCVESLGAQLVLSIAGDDEQSVDVRVSVSDAHATVSFYARDRFRGVLYVDEPYGPLRSLRTLSTRVTAVSVEHDHLDALFTIAKALPALGSLHLALKADEGVRTQFWSLKPVFWLKLKCTALSELEISCEGGQRDRVIPSDQLAQFARDIGLSDAHRPHLTLRGITVEGGAHHIPYFSDADE